MKNVGTRGLFIVAATSLLAACAAQAPVSPSSSTPVAAAAPVAAASAAAPVSAAASATPSASELAAARKKAFPTTGYRKVVKNGVELYCQKDGYTGSRLSGDERCYTEAQLTARREADADFLRRQQNRVGDQPTANGPGGGTQYSAASPAP